MLASERPRNLGWFGSAGLLFGDWGTSRLYVLGLAFLVAGRSSFWLIVAMSLLILAVAWAYSHVCRIYPDGGGVYTAARQKAAILGVVGALLLFADYTITASLSAVDGFHYFGVGNEAVEESVAKEPPANGDIVLESEEGGSSLSLWSWNSPGLWAIVAIIGIGGLNLLGPKHTAGPAIFAAVGMVAITLLITIFAIPQIHWRQVDWGSAFHAPLHMWEAFVAIVLALSGVEAIASLTGTMRRPVFTTSSKAIWIVAAEVAVFNVLLAIVMIATADLGRTGHKEDMLAFLAKHYVGAWGEWPVRIVGGVLLLSATNTAIGAIASTVYIMSRDGELPRFLQKLNPFGAPWVGVVIATLVPAGVLVAYHDLVTLSHLYAIGIVGAVAMNCLITATHPRLRKWWRKIAMFSLGGFLVAVWLTLAVTKLPALIFVTCVMAFGLGARYATKMAAKRRPKMSLLRQAIIEQLTPDALAKPKYMVCTAGGSQLAEQSCRAAQAGEASLVVCFVRDVALNYKVEGSKLLTLDTDPAAIQVFTDYLEAGHRHSVPIIPAYDTGANAPEMIAELAALNGVHKVFIGTSRRGAIHQIIKGSFQRKVESILPTEIEVDVLSPE